MQKRTGRGASISRKQERQVGAAAIFQDVEGAARWTNAMPTVAGRVAAKA